MQVDVITAAIQGNEPACRELFELWYPKAYRIAKSICGKRELAEDAVQEALIRFWRALPRLKDPETADRFFYKTAANEARRMFSRRKRRETALRQADYEAAGDPAEDELRDARAALRAAVEKLPEKLRSAVKLHYFGGFGEAETAELLGATVSSVKMRLMRGRQRLRKILEQSGYEVTEG